MKIIYNLYSDSMNASRRWWDDYSQSLPLENNYFPIPI